MERLVVRAFTGGMDLLAALLFAATVTTGLVAGLLFSYAGSVMPALARVDDRTFVESCGASTSAILNGWFLVPFLARARVRPCRGADHLGAAGPPTASGPSPASSSTSSRSRSPASSTCRSTTRWRPSATVQRSRAAG